MQAFENALLLLVLLTALSVIGRKLPWPMPITYVLGATLAATLLLEDGRPFPARDIVIFLSLGVVMVTLLLQGTTLEFLICKLGLRADASLFTAERLARTTAVEAGLKLLRRQAAEATAPEAAAALGEVVAEYEHRLAELTAEGETRISVHRRRPAGRKFRLEALRAERVAVDDLWIRDAITDETHRPLQQLLDHEEAMLNGQEGRPESGDGKPASGSTA